MRENEISGVLFVSLSSGADMSPGLWVGPSKIPANVCPLAVANGSHDDISQGFPQFILTLELVSL